MQHLTEHPSTEVCREWGIHLTSKVGVSVCALQSTHLYPDGQLALPSLGQGLGVEHSLRSLSQSNLVLQYSFLSILLLSRAGWGFERVGPHGDPAKQLFKTISKYTNAPLNIALSSKDSRFTTWALIIQPRRTRFCTFTVIDHPGPRDATGIPSLCPWIAD